jgi:hypothetical protein
MTHLLREGRWLRIAMEIQKSFVSYTTVLQLHTCILTENSEKLHVLFCYCILKGLGTILAVRMVARR